MSNILLILGASSDIGLDLIKNLGHKCLIIAHYNSSNIELIKAQKEIANKLVTVQADLSSEVETVRFINYIEENFGTPTQIVHLVAPKFENIRFKDASWESFQNNINTSLRSLTIVLNRFLPTLAKNQGGKVICMLSSVTIGVPPKTLTEYTTVKYALLGLIKSLASEYADKNIQINAISPSMVDTKFLSNINHKIVELNAYTHPTKRNAQAGDITPVINMLLSENSNYINGVNIAITGGSNF
jgi:3-oxoacyl-[acyl-carrier protein] reductase